MKKILLIEDDLTVLHSLSLIFEKDYEVEEYSDAKQALERLREDSYDLVIADLFLNEITGLDIYELAKDKSRFIIITAYPERELALKAKSLLGDRFIPKSTPPEILKSKVASILKEEK
jgi:DNA-binding response OmpR family regulator